jgi:hypothetical protein
MMRRSPARRHGRTAYFEGDFAYDARMILRFARDPSAVAVPTLIPNEYAICL